MDLGLTATVDIAGIRFSSTTLGAAARWLANPRQGRARHVHLANAYTISLAVRDGDYARLISDPESVVLPDGRPLEWLTRMEPVGLRQIRGPSLFEATLAASELTGVRHYLLGGSADTLARLNAVVRERYPKAIVAGSLSPSFGGISATEQQEIVESIRQAQPDLVWVGLGTPKQDYQAALLTRTADVTTVAVGAAFDFMAGVKRAAPAWVSYAGFEWLFRLMSEPRRLWRRYLVGNTVFVGAMIQRAWSANRRAANVD